MYKRYPVSPPKNSVSNKPLNSQPPRKQAPPKPQEKEPQKEEKKRADNFFAKFIPSSVYNPQSGKVFGILSTEDLFILALILLLLDSEEPDEDNSMLILALIYILLSEHIDLPF